MKILKVLAMLAPVALLAGCLEVDQHPHWVKGMYAGKRDNRPMQVMYHNDKLSWWGMIANRTMHQNEYNRANP